MVSTERGQGARLRPFGEKLLEVDDAAAGSPRARTGRQTARAESRGGRESSAARKPLVIHASHDWRWPICETSSPRRGSVIELHFRGSLESLADHAHGLCESPDFMCPRFPPTRSVTSLPPLAQGALAGPRAIRDPPPGADGRPWESERHPEPGRPREQRPRTVHQSPAGDPGPAPISVLAGRGNACARRRSRAIERGGGSHAAVAATVASGMADAGFGIEAAAGGRRGTRLHPARHGTLLSRRTRHHYCHHTDAGAARNFDKRRLPRMLGSAAGLRSTRYRRGQSSLATRCEGSGLDFLPRRFRSSSVSAPPEMARRSHALPASTTTTSTSMAMMTVKACRC